MSTTTFAFTATQIDTLKTSLDMRLERVNDMIQIFSKDPENKEDQWMVGRYTAEREEAQALLAELRKA
jgi:hypothetical protein